MNTSRESLRESSTTKADRLIAQVASSVDSLLSFRLGDEEVGVEALRCTFENDLRPIFARNEVVIDEESQDIRDAVLQGCAHLYPKQIGKVLCSIQTAMRNVRIEIDEQRQ